jgi:hypothetical protein
MVHVSIAGNLDRYNDDAVTLCGQFCDERRWTMAGFISRERCGLSTQFNLIAKFDAQPSPSSTNLNELKNHSEIDVNEN